MDLCKICKERKHCREMCQELGKEISARGVSPRQKDKTYSVDMSYLEETKNPLNEFQQEVARRLVCDDWDDFFTRLDFVEVIDKVLAPRERLIIQLILEEYTQEEIGQKLKIVKSRVNFLLQRAKMKIKKFYLGGEQNAQNSVLPIGARQ